MRITKKVREEAATICAIAASTPDLDGNYSWTCELLGWKPRSKAYNLAHLAWSHACTRLRDSGLMPHPDDRDRWCVVEAEAVSLLRTGWKP